jgi:hypothetical protein
MSDTVASPAPAEPTLSSSEKELGGKADSGSVGSTDSPPTRGGASDNDAAHATAAAGFTPGLARKLDFYILTPMFFLNFLSLMGRTNIGAALIQKLPLDLKMGAMDIFLAVAMPVVMLIVFEIPSNLIMKWLDKRFGIPYMRYLSAITACLGKLRPRGVFLATSKFQVGARRVVD